jgi:hypothetical protein
MLKYNIKNTELFRALSFRLLRKLLNSERAEGVTVEVEIKITFKKGPQGKYVYCGV